MSAHEREDGAYIKCKRHHFLGRSDSERGRLYGKRTRSRWQGCLFAGTITFTFLRLALVARPFAIAAAAAVRHANKQKQLEISKWEWAASSSTIGDVVRTQPPIAHQRE